MPWLTVWDNVAFGIRKKEKNRENISGIISTVGLEGFEKAYPFQLSGGMQQRAAIARALAYRPSFIMMDEPFAALDYFTREQMQKELLRVQQKQRCSILFVTHSIDEALLLGLQDCGHRKRTCKDPRCRCRSWQRKGTCWMTCSFP